MFRNAAFFLALLVPLILLGSWCWRSFSEAFYRLPRMTPSGVWWSIGT